MNLVFSATRTAIDSGAVIVLAGSAELLMERHHRIRNRREAEVPPVGPCRQRPEYRLATGAA